MSVLSECVFLSDIVYMEFKGYGFTVTVEETQMVVHAASRVAQKVFEGEIVTVPYHTITGFKYSKGNIFVNTSIRLTFMDDVLGERKLLLAFIPMGAQKRNAAALKDLLEDKLSIV